VFLTWDGSFADRADSVAVHGLRIERRYLRLLVI